MAFFEFLSALGDLLSSAAGKFIKPVGGQNTGGISPGPKAGLPPAQSASNAGLVVQDADGSLRVRASIITSRQELRDDFTGSSLTTSLTGTPTFTNGSAIVTGSGTLFTTELNRDFFIKRDSDGEANWTKVRRIISDTSLELESNYPGTTGGSASSKTKWPTTTGSGGSFTVGSSLVNVLSGTTNGSRTFISRSFDTSDMTIFFKGLSVSQRIANQTISVGLFDSVASPAQQVAIIFDGTTNTTLKFRTSFTSTATDVQETTVTLPFGLTTNLSTTNYTILYDGKQATLLIQGVVVASHEFHMPEPYTTLIAAVAVLNSAAVTTTTVSVDSIYLKAYDEIDVPPIAGILPTDEFHSIAGSLTTTATTADQVIVSYTVPTGKVAYLTAYYVSSNANTDGTPIKIGKNTITTEPAAPGTADGNIFRMFFITRSSAPAPATAQESFAEYPRPFAFAGDVVKMTVTPSGAGTTIWRGHIDVILRKY